MLTNSKSHDFELFPDQLHHPALLERRDSAAEHRAAVLGQLKEATLQVWGERHAQGASVHDQRDVLGRAHVTGVRIVPPHLFQRAVQDGGAR